MYMNEIKRENCRCMNTFTKSRLSRKDEVHTDRMLRQPKVKNAGKPKQDKETDIFAFKEKDKKLKARAKPKPKTKMDNILDVSEPIGNKNKLKLKDY